MRVEDVMTTEVATVTPGTSLKDVAQILVEHDISGVPVVDAHGVVLGVVSEADLLAKERAEPPMRGGPLAWLVDPIEIIERRKLGARVAGEVMTSPAVTIAPYRNLATAAGVMLDNRVNRLPVVHDGQLVGIVTRADLVRAFARSDAEVLREIRQDVLGRQMLLDDYAVDVAVDAGDVVLSGVMGRRSQVELIPRLVARVAGVVGIDNKLTWREDDTVKQARAR
jgi:CBS-domain-containing membrane protein